MQFKETVPKDAAAVILFKDEKNFLAQRNPKISFLGGWYAFPGGKIDAADAEIEVRNCADANLKKFIVGAVRETFEEVGVLLARGGDALTSGQRLSLRNDLLSGTFSFAEILDNWGLSIDAADFEDAGFWTTPKFSPIRFRTRFLIARCPRKQSPQTFGEFTRGELLTAQEALQNWKRGEILIAPPVLIALGEAAKSVENLGAKLREKSIRNSGEILHIKINPQTTVFPVRTETLPPATHTNCFVVGEKEFVVIDAAAPFPEEQRKLHDFIDSLIDKGNSVKSLIVTHLHPDHFLGVSALQKHLKEKFDLEIPIAAHRATAQSLKNRINVEKFIEDNELIELKDAAGETFSLRALHTPGHARGHLCFYDERLGFLLSGDNVVSTGSVLIAAPEGNMTDYLMSLERLKNLPNLRFLCGAHGAAVYDAKSKIESYIEHRLERERKILAALSHGADNIEQIVAEVYADVPESLHRLAKLAVEAHLEKIHQDKILNQSKEI